MRRIRTRDGILFKISRLKIFCLIFIGVVFMQVGFAALSTNLMISGEAKITPPIRKLLYAPFDEIGEAMPPGMLVYVPMDGLGYPKPPVNDFITDRVSKTAFAIKGGSVTENTATKKIGDQSAHFSGVPGQRINANISNLNLGTNDFTISFWLYPETQVNLYGMIFGYEQNYQNGGIQFMLNDNGKISLAISNGTSNVRVITSKTYTPNIWTHYALVRKDGIFTLYENGINIGSTSSYKTTNINLSNFSIGGINASNIQYKGYMDDFAIYNYAKYTNDFTPSTEAQSDANILYLDFENIYVFNKEPIKNIISDDYFNILGDANIMGTDIQKKFGDASLYFI